MAADRLQQWRRLSQAGFMLLFLIAPAVDLLRFDLHERQLWLFGQPWSLGLSDLQAGRVGVSHTVLTLLTHGLLPLLLLVGGFLAVAWRQGRLYCGWLCPHFSLVEAINAVLQRACGRLSLWDRTPVPLAGGRHPQRRWWVVYGLACVLAGTAWGITLLCYLLPPAEVWGGLLHGSSTPGQLRFIVIASGVFALEFALARHLFCRYGCAVGLFQSLVWMANPRARVVGFARERAAHCRGCVPDATRPTVQASACEQACPMRLTPRQTKRWMFACVQCGRCLTACDRAQHTRAALEGGVGVTPLLQWTVGSDAFRESLRQRRPVAAVAAPPAAAPAPTPARTLPPPDPKTEES
ncbi:MAG: hypothetical protein RIQ53_3851 [Pseudomonadota bacterium]